MLKIAHSYTRISEIMQKPEAGNPYPDKQAVLGRMIESLPLTPWANIKIADWLPADDTLSIEYYFYNTAFGKVLAANTSKGICYLGLVSNSSQEILADLRYRFRHTNCIETESSLQRPVVCFLNGNTEESLLFHLRGTTYQIEIWRKLIRIPYGKVISYAALGEGAANARAASTANGRNPIFWIIPCHRVVNTTGCFSRYFWGDDIKRNLLAWEFANTPAAY